MPALPRRERWGVAGSILEAIDREHTERGPQARVTNVAVRANVPYDRLVTYLESMAAAGLVQLDKMPRLTPEGEDVLRQYRQWTEVVRRYGFL
ncbi:MAG: Winged helix-turn-helix [Thermoplasmata archaeon]|nr:Winged helix-turn-helix [Thermoplasmata archaeon]